MCHCVYVHKITSIHVYYTVPAHYNSNYTFSLPSMAAQARSTNISLAISLAFVTYHLFLYQKYISRKIIFTKSGFSTCQINVRSGQRQFFYVWPQECNFLKRCFWQTFKRNHLIAFNFQEKENPFSIYFYNSQY